MSGATLTPVTDRPSRLASMAKVEDGVAYCISGRGGQCELVRVLYKQDRFEKLGVIKDEEGICLWQCHDIAAAKDGKTLYICENDNPYRSSYLWEITDFA